MRVGQSLFGFLVRTHDRDRDAQRAFASSHQHANAARWLAGLLRIIGDMMRSMRALYRPRRRAAARAFIDPDMAGRSPNLIGYSAALTYAYATLCQ